MTGGGDGDYQCIDKTCNFPREEIESKETEIGFEHIRLRIVAFELNGYQWIPQIHLLNFKILELTKKCFVPKAYIFNIETSDDGDGITMAVKVGEGSEDR